LHVNYKYLCLVPVTPPAQRVQFILGEDAEEGNGHETHPLFSEMGELVREGDDFEWKEVRHQHSTRSQTHLGRVGGEKYTLPFRRDLDDVVMNWGKALKSGPVWK
jgi:hypothetical protein